MDAKEIKICYDILRNVMEQIASDKRRTRARVLAQSTLSFIDTQIEARKKLLKSKRV